MKIRSKEEIERLYKDGSAEEKRDYIERVHSAYYPLDEQTGFRVELDKLSESQLNETLNNHMTEGYIIISTWGEKLKYPEFGSYEAWQLIMAEMSNRLYRRIGDSGYSYTPVQGEWICGDSATADEVVFQRSFIVFNHKKGNFIPLEKRLEELKKLGQDWCKAFNLSFLYVPNREQETAANDSYHPAYYLNEDGKIKEIFNSLNVLTDTDRFLSLLNKDINSDYSDGQFLSYQEGVLWFPGGRGRIQDPMTLMRLNEVLANVKKGDKNAE